MRLLTCQPPRSIPAVAGKARNRGGVTVKFGSFVRTSQPEKLPFGVAKTQPTAPTAAAHYSARKFLTNRPLTSFVCLRNSKSLPDIHSAQDI